MNDNPNILADSETWQPGQLLLNDFEVQRVLGQGGMGKVYLVRSRSTGSECALKRAKGLKEADRRAFLSELQIWIDLPEHTNLVPCRFFRTIGKEVLIFAEYVESGSLDEWIGTRKLYEGSLKKALERILDIAIQFAWGLHCLHEIGLFHQDVKPANVLITSDGIVRINDFGLARAPRKRNFLGFGKGAVLSRGGFTPAYCSPEQAENREIDWRTDLWSWSVSVLEMFQGEVTWQSGSAASEALELFLEHNGEGENIPPMPPEVAKLLRDCFQRNTAQRCGNLDEVVQTLRRVYSVVIGVDYVRALDKPKPRVAARIGDFLRRSPQGYSWTDPQACLKRALQAAGSTSEDAARAVAASARSRRGQMAADIAAFDEARGIYERLIRQGRQDLQYELSVLCVNAALVHETIGDFSGAFAFYDRAIEIHQVLNTDNDDKSGTILAALCEQKANVATRAGDDVAALAMHDRAIAIYERLNLVGDNQDLNDGLAAAYSGKAVALMNLGRGRASLGFYDKAAEVLERLVSSKSTYDSLNSLATLYLNKGNALAGMGDIVSALGLYDKAIKIRERLVYVEGQSQLLHSLALLYSNKANCVDHYGDATAAVSLYEKAIAILGELVNAEGLGELANDLASLYVNAGIANLTLGNYRRAAELYDSAIEIREGLVNEDGRTDLAVSLARVYMNKANMLVNTDHMLEALRLYDRAIEILIRVNECVHSSELVTVFVHLCLNKGYVMAEKLGDYIGSIGLYDRALTLCKSAANDRGDLTELLGRLYNAKAIALMNSKQNDAAVELFDYVLTLLEQQISKGPRYDIEGAIRSVKEYRKQALIQPRHQTNR